MKWFRNIRIFWVVIAAVGVIAVVVAEEPIKNLRVNLDYYPTGELKTELFAKWADVPPDGKIIAQGLVLNGFTLDGKVEMEIIAEDCVYDQDKGVASSTNAVALTRGDITVNGKGFEWSGGDKKLKILKKAKVVFPAAIIKNKGVLESVKKK